MTRYQKEKRRRETEVDALYEVLGKIVIALKPAQKMWQKERKDNETFPDIICLIKWLTRRARK